LKEEAFDLRMSGSNRVPKRAGRSSRPGFGRGREEVVMGAVLAVAIHHMNSIREAVVACLPGVVGHSLVLTAGNDDFNVDQVLREEYRRMNNLQAREVFNWLEREKLPVEQSEINEDSGGRLLSSSMETKFKEYAGASMQDYVFRFEVSRVFCLRRNRNLPPRELAAILSRRNTHDPRTSSLYG
jgi:hypothetical protein